MPREHVEVSQNYRSDPAKLWQVLGDFSAAWHPEIASSRVKIDAESRALVREFHDHQGAVFRERLTYYSTSEHLLRYTMLDGIKGCTSYNAEVLMRPGDDSGSRVFWRADISAARDNLSTISDGTKYIFTQGLKSLEEVKPSNPSPKRTEPPAKLIRQTVGGTPRLSMLMSDALQDSDTAIIFLHGIGGNAGNWSKQLREFGRRFKVAALDMRGYGDSTFGFAPTMIDDYCQDILAAANALDARKIILVGLSMGSWIATSFAMRHRNMLAGLVLAGGCTGMSEAEEDEREAFRVSRVIPMQEGKTPADFAESIVNVIAGPSASETTRTELRQSMAAISSEAYVDALNCFCNPIEKFDLSKLDLPVLLMTGQHDRLAPPEEIRALSFRIFDTLGQSGRVPDVRFEVLTDAGHVCNLEQPDQFNAHLDAFLERVASDRGITHSRREKARSAKLNRILDGALAEFCAKGFGGASMEAIARRAGVSKPTLYSYVGDKEALLARVLDKGRSDIVLPLQSPDKSLVERLWLFSWSYAELVLRPDMLALARLVLGEAGRMPESAQTYYQSGPARAFSGIVEFLQQSEADGRLTLDDAEMAAEHLWALILSGPRTHFLHFVSDRPRHSDLLRSIGAGLKVFLTAYSTVPEQDLIELNRLIMDEDERMKRAEYGT